MSLISPFFPPFAEEKGISSELVGYIFSANPIGAFCAAVVLGKIMTEHNRVRFMLSALVL
jgi:MFS family permease